VDYSTPHITPMKQKFLDARRADGGVVIGYKHENSDEVIQITEGVKNVIPSEGYWCTVHGGFNYVPCSCTYETRID
jgi:hypothetical protein